MAFTISIKVLVFLCITTTGLSSFNNGGKNRIACNERERQALLKFKHALNSTSKILSSWEGDDCCSWMGVGCNNATGRVIMLNLRKAFSYAGEQVFGEIDSSLLELKHLKHLDLSLNNFRMKPIPKFFGSFKKLRYLNLSRTSFSGTVPPQLGNMSSLLYLDLSCGYLDELKVDNLGWLSHFSSLRHLDMDNVNLSMTVDWLQDVNKLRSLSVLDLSHCQLKNFHNLPRLNFTSLISLDLSQNYISNSKLLEWLVNLHNLVYLDLSSNKFVGAIPDALGSLCNLKKVDLSWNNLQGEVNGFLKRLSTCGEFVPLTYLDLGHNNFSGTVSQSLGQLLELIDLKLSHNSFEGVLSATHFSNLTKLESLDMSSNPFALNLGPDWIPPSKLKVIKLGHCHLGPLFPMWLRFQKNYLELNFSNAQISDTFPNWFWNVSSKVYLMDLSHNQIYGKIPSSFGFSRARIDLSSNCLEGPLPNNISGALMLDLSNNFFSGPININPSSMWTLSLSNNYLDDSIPLSICNFTFMSILDLSKNHLTGRIPLCIANLQWLQVLDLSNNNLSGKIPNVNVLLTWLKLSHNNLSGELLLTPMNVSSLITLDLSHNSFSGVIPACIGERLFSLKILNLRSNMFHGKIPPQLCYLLLLQILDLSDNHLSGSIPKHFYSFAMRSPQNIKSNLMQFAVSGRSYGESIQVTMKGYESEYTTTLSLVVVMDLSRNNLSGEIPEGLTSLYGLQSLNLSQNNLEGKIPENISNLRQLQSLDFSKNCLSGTIPSSISALNFLSSLNLSYNNLSGHIPSGNQLQTLIDPSIYIGNRDLCGPPISDKCPWEKVPQPTENSSGEGEEEKIFDSWFYISIMPGFVVGFWLVCGALLLSKSWRIAYFRFFDNLSDWLCGLFVHIYIKFLKK